MTEPDLTPGVCEQPFHPEGPHPYDDGTGGRDYPCIKWRELEPGEKGYICKGWAESDLEHAAHVRAEQERAGYKW